MIHILVLINSILIGFTSAIAYYFFKKKEYEVSIFAALCCGFILGSTFFVIMN
jgi:hypothetical protein